MSPKTQKLDALRSLEVIRGEIHALKAKIESAASALVPKDEALRRMNSHISGLAANAFLDSEAYAQSNYIAPDLMGRAVDISDVIEMMATFASDAMRKRLTADIDRLYSQNTGITQTEREKIKAESRAKLFDLEVEEERVICELEASGLIVPRRAGADPAAILAVAIPE